jgi:hypothetical protein
MCADKESAKTKTDQIIDVMERLIAVLERSISGPRNQESVSQKTTR